MLKNLIKNTPWVFLEWETLQKTKHDLKKAKKKYKRAKKKWKDCKKCQ